MTSPPRVDVTDLPVVTASALPGIAALCARAVTQPFSDEELAKALFSPEQPATVRFAPGVGMVATVASGRRVAPPAGGGPVGASPGDRPTAPPGGGAGPGGGEGDHDRAKRRTSCIPASRAPRLASARCSRTRSHVGGDQLQRRGPPGRPARRAARRRRRWPRGPRGGRRLARAALAHSAPGGSALDQGTLLLTRDASGIAGFCAFDVNRARTLGPIASRPDLIGAGASRGLLVSALLRMRDRGYETIEVLWVGPLVPYAAVGGRIGATFFVYRKRRPAPEQSGSD